MKFVVDIIESERGWGQKVDSTRIFDSKNYGGSTDKTLKAAKRFVKRFNSENTSKTAPDFYMYAKEPKMIEAKKGEKIMSLATYRANKQKIFIIWKDYNGEYVNVFVKGKEKKAWAFYNKLKKKANSRINSYGTVVIAYVEGKMIENEGTQINFKS